MPSEDSFTSNGFMFLTAVALIVMFFIELVSPGGNFPDDFEGLTAPGRSGYGIERKRASEGTDSGGLKAAKKKAMEIYKIVGLDALSKMSVSEMFKFVALTLYKAIGGYGAGGQSNSGGSLESITKIISAFAPQAANIDGSDLIKYGMVGAGGEFMGCHPKSGKFRAVNQGNGQMGGGPLSSMIASFIPF